MKHKWTVIFGSVAVFGAGAEEAEAESKRIGCGSIPYVRHWLDANATIPRCSLEHVSAPSRTYAVYRDVTMHGQSMAWAFEGFLKSPPEKVEAGPGPRHYRFEASVAAFNGAVATCWAGFKDSARGPDIASHESAAAYAVALTCTTKDHASPMSDDAAYEPIRNIMLK